MRKFLLPGLILALFVVLAACGGEEPTAVPPTAVPATAVPATVAPTAMAAPSGGMAQLTSSGLDIELQYVCVNRTLRPCEHVQEFIEAVRTRTDGQVEIQLSSYPELGISGFDMIRLIDDGTVGFGEIYSGFVGGEYPAFNITNLWGAFSTPEEYFQATDAVADDMVRLVGKESNGGKVVAFNFYPINFYFSKDPINSLADFEGVRTRSHSDVLSDLIGHLGADPQTMAFADVYPALERGVLDAAVTCGTCAIGQKWFEVTDYVTGPFPAPSPQPSLPSTRKSGTTSPKTFKRLSKRKAKRIRIGRGSRYLNGTRPDSKS